MHVLIVGYGRMGQLHQRVLHQLGHTTTTIDPNGHADHTRQPPARYDAAVVATPIRRLFATANPLIRAGIPTLVEKPFAHNHHAAEELARVSRNRIVAVGYTECHNPAVDAVMRELTVIGDIHQVHATRLGVHSSPEHPLLDLATHDIAVTLHLGLNPAKATYRAQHSWPTKQRHFQIVGSLATLAVDYQRQTVLFNDTPVLVDQDEPLKREWLDFERAIQTGQPPRVTPARAVEVLKAAGQLMRAEIPVAA